MIQTPGLPGVFLCTKSLPLLLEVVEAMQLISKGRPLSLDRPHVMGILNVTPDSFSDGGRFKQIDLALGHARDMVADGATLIDIGGESTRPGAPDVSEQEELDRVIPVVERMVAELDVMISLDTSKAIVMREGCAAGGHLINDVRALQEPGALGAAAEAGVPVCLMHMQGQPRTMQVEPHYDDLLGDNSSMKLTMENVLSYDKTFGKHKVGAVIGYTIEKTDWVQSAMSKKDFISNDTPVFDAGNVLTSIGGSKSTHAIVGKLFRLQYAYDGRYMLSASGRYDGSSRMAKNNRYAFFPGVSLGWNINEEKFLKNVDWLSNLKLRASYGEFIKIGVGQTLHTESVRHRGFYQFGSYKIPIAIKVLQRNQCVNYYCRQK
jgi:hypothetical protein